MDSNICVLESIEDEGDEFNQEMNVEQNLEEGESTNIQRRDHRTTKEQYTKMVNFMKGK